MKEKRTVNYCIRQPEESEYAELGKLTVDIYSQLPGMPGLNEQPEYYAMLADVKTRAAAPATEILIAVSDTGEILGGVTFIKDMKFYGSGGTAHNETGGSGIRLLAVKPEARGLGVGKALTNACIEKTRESGKSEVILHTTKSMEVAWEMYLRLGFKRSPDLDFDQKNLKVFGFRLKIS